MLELIMDIPPLPDDIREKLAELELELSEGEFDNFICAVTIYLSCHHH